MTSPAQQRQVDENYDAFRRVLGKLLPAHRDRYALMRDRQVIEIFDTPAEALRAGVDCFVDDLFSIQEVTDEPIDLGFWSHAAVH